MESVVLGSVPGRELSERFCWKLCLWSWNPWSMERARDPIKVRHMCNKSTSSLKTHMKFMFNINRTGAKLWKYRHIKVWWKKHLPRRTHKVPLTLGAHVQGMWQSDSGKTYIPEFPYTTPGALFRKSMLLDWDFLNSAPGLYMENSGRFRLCREVPMGAFEYIPRHPSNGNEVEFLCYLMTLVRTLLSKDIGCHVW